MGTGTMGSHMEEELINDYEYLRCRFIEVEEFEKCYEGISCDNTILGESQDW